MEDTKKAWMGIGISNSYVKILKNMPVGFLGKYAFLLLILADEINQKYNFREKKQLTQDIFNFANKIRIKGVEIKVKHWNFLSQKLKYKKLLKEYKNLFKHNVEFKKFVLKIVKKNRRINFKGNEEIMANYVLEELASINYFSMKKITKIGPKNKEMDFDILAKKYPLTQNILTETF